MAIMTSARKKMKESFNAAPIDPPKKTTPVPSATTTMLAPTPASIRGGDADYVDQPAIAAAPVSVPATVANPAAAVPAPAPAATVPQSTGTATAPAPAPAPTTNNGSTMATNSYKAQADDLTRAVQIKPVTNEFDESKGAEGRVGSIIAKNSPLMELAASKAKQQMNARGLLNSSMAVGAGQRAVMEAATPIALQDASLFQQQILANQNAENRTNEVNAGNTTTIGTTGMQLGESSRQFDTGEANEASRFEKTLAQRAEELAQQNQQFGQELDLKKADLTQRKDLFNAELSQRDTQFTAKQAQDKVLAEADNATKIQLSEMESKWRNEIAGNENISNAWGTTMNAIDKIQNNPELDSATKTALIQNAIGGFQSFTGFWQKATGGAVDVSDLLDFGITTTGTNTGPTGDSGGGGSAGVSGGGSSPVYSTGDSYGWNP